MENLYLRHAAKDNFATAQQALKTLTRSSGGAGDDVSAEMRQKNAGVSMSRELLEGQIYESQGRGNPNFAKRQNLGDGPPRQQANAFMNRNRLVDARQLGESPGSPISRGGSQRPRQPTMGLSMRQRYPPRPPGGVVQDRREPQVPAVGGEGRSRDRGSRDSEPQSRIARTEGGYRPRQGEQGDVRPVRQNGFSGERSSTTGGRGRTQPGLKASGPRTSRNEEGGGLSRRKRNQPAGPRIGPEDRTPTLVWNDEELEYLKQKRERQSAKSTAYDPEGVDQESFSSVVPAFVSSEHGMSQVLTEKLMLAKGHLEGEHVEWHSKEQKADVMTLVNRLKGIRSEEKQKRLNKDPSSEGTKETPSTSDETEFQTQSLLQKLLGGQYEFTRSQQSKGIMGNVARHTDRNESYFPIDQKSLLEKVKSLLPADDPRRGSKDTKARIRT